MMDADLVEALVEAAEDWWTPWELDFVTSLEDRLEAHDGPRHEFVLHDNQRDELLDLISRDPPEGEPR